MKIIHLNQIKFQLIQLIKYPVFLFLNLLNSSILLFFIFFVNVEFKDNTIKTITIGTIHIGEEILYSFIPLFTQDIIKIYLSLLLFLIIIGYSYFLSNLYKSDLTILSLLKNISRRSYFLSHILSFFLILLIITFLFSIFLDAIIHLKIKLPLSFFITKLLSIEIIKIVLILSLLNLISIFTKNFTLIFLFGLLIYFLILPSIYFINNDTAKTILNLITGNILYYRSLSSDLEALPNLTPIDMIYTLVYVIGCYLISFLHFNKYDFR